MTPCARTLQALRSSGWIAEKVEQRLPIPGRFVTRDMGGFADIVAWKPGSGIKAVQVTTGSNLGAHMVKIRTECREKATAWLESGGILELWGWRQLKVKRGGKAVRWVPDVRAFDRLLGVDTSNQVSYNPIP